MKLQDFRTREIDVEFGHENEDYGKQFEMYCVFSHSSSNLISTFDSSLARPSFPEVVQ